MPRASRKIQKRYDEGVEVLDFEMERCFLVGYGLLGTHINLRTLDDWRFHWQRWRATVMPKALDHRPGLRPFACYVCGEVPERPVLTPPPLSHGFFHLYVPARDGTGTWHYRYPEPYQRAEPKHLLDLGVIDKAEIRRHREWQATRSETACGNPQCTYPFEQGLYV
jgi:hypothetical protein